MASLSCPLQKEKVHLSEKRFLDATFDDPCELGVEPVIQLGGDDGRADVLGRVDDFLDARHALRDV